MPTATCNTRKLSSTTLGRRTLSTVLTVMIGGWLSVSTAAAANVESYPDKPISLVVSYPAGGSVDVAARLLQVPLTNALGQQVVVENKGGAGGTIGTAIVGKAKPDGYTLLITLSSHTINPAIYNNLSFDTERDFAPISLVASAPQVLVANPAFPPSSLEELITYAKNQKNEVPFGTAGTGSPSHIAGELFKLKTGLNLSHVPYRGGGPATIDVLGGTIPLLWVSLPSVTQHIKSGRLKALAVSTKERTPVLPDVPSVSETIKDFNVDSWYAMFAPANTPQAIINKIQTAIAAAAKDPKIQEAFLAQGAVVIGSTPATLDQIVKTEIPMWKALAQQTNIKVD